MLNNPMGRVPIGLRVVLAANLAFTSATLGHMTVAIEALALVATSILPHWRDEPIPGVANWPTADGRIQIFSPLHPGRMIEREDLHTLAIWADKDGVIEWGLPEASSLIAAAVRTVGADVPQSVRNLALVYSIAAESTTD